MRYWNQYERSSKVSRAISVVAEVMGMDSEAILDVEAEDRVVVVAVEAGEVEVLASSRSCAGRYSIKLDDILRKQMQPVLSI